MEKLEPGLFHQIPFQKELSEETYLEVEKRAFPFAAFGKEWTFHIQLVDVILTLGVNANLQRNKRKLSLPIFLIFCPKPYKT